MSNPNPPAAAPRGRRLRGWIGALLLLAYGFFLDRHTIVVAGGSDSSGYLNSARLFAAGELTGHLRTPPELAAASREHPAHFTPSGFLPSPDRTRLHPTYPTGLPLHFAAAGRLLGWDLGPRLVLLGAALAAVWLCYRTARELGLAPELAAAGAVILGAFPVFLFTSVQPLSDTLATTWVLAAFYFALRARRRRAWALAAGAGLAIAVLVRPTNLLLAPALLVLLAGDARRLAAFALGGVPGAIWLAVYNFALYGHPLRSGYGDIFAAFGLAYGLPTAGHFVRWLALLLPAVVLPLAVVPVLRRESRSRAWWALALAAGAITGCYAFYEVSHEVWWCLRFILPAVPPLLLAALLGVEALARGPGARWPRAFRPAAAAGLAAWAMAGSWGWSSGLGVYLIRHYEGAYAAGAEAARARLPAGALVACLSFSGTMYFYTDHPVLRWDQVEPAEFARYAGRAHAAGRPVCAVLFESEEAGAFRRCPGNWVRLLQTGNVGLWQLDSGVRSP